MPFYILVRLTTVRVAELRLFTGDISWADQLAEEIAEAPEAMLVAARNNLERMVAGLNKQAEEAKELMAYVAESCARTESVDISLKVLEPIKQELRIRFGWVTAEQLQAMSDEERRQWRTMASDDAVNTVYEAVEDKVDAL